jgi:hypothetical protein
MTEPFDASWQNNLNGEIDAVLERFSLTPDKAMRGTIISAVTVLAYKISQSPEPSGQTEKAASLAFSAKMSGYLANSGLAYNQVSDCIEALHQVAENASKGIDPQYSRQQQLLVVPPESESAVSDKPPPDEVVGGLGVYEGGRKTQFSPSRITGKKLQMDIQNRKLISVDDPRFAEREEARRKETEVQEGRGGLTP